MNARRQRPEILAARIGIGAVKLSWRIRGIGYSTLLLHA